SRFPTAPGRSCAAASLCSPTRRRVRRSHRPCRVLARDDDPGADLRLHGLPGHPQGTTLLQGARGRRALRRSRGAPGGARRAPALRRQVRRRGAHRSRGPALQGPRPARRARFARAPAGARADRAAPLAHAARALRRPRGDRACAGGLAGVGGHREAGRGQARMTPRPFTIKVADDVLADLRARLERVRWPDEAPDAAWRYGTSVAYMKELVEYWRRRYDWRVHEARLNTLRQFTIALDGIAVHFIHEPGVGPAPMPLLLSHGWPGSIVEFERI